MIAGTAFGAAYPHDPHSQCQAPAGWRAAEPRAKGAHGFILVRDGTEPVAVTDSHGTWLEWLG